MSRAPLAGVTGYVLAGGQSSRMGRDKAFVEIEGATFLERALLTLEAFCEVCCILCGGAERAERFEPASVRRGARLVFDTLPGEGPLAGVAAAARDAATAWLLVLPIDLPMLPAAVVRDWVERSMNSAAHACCLRAQGVVQPLPVLLRRDLAEPLELALARGERRLRPALQQAATQRGGDFGFAATDAAAFGAEAEVWFANLNSPEDLETFARSRPV